MRPGTVQHNEESARQSGESDDCRQSISSDERQPSRTGPTYTWDSQAEAAPSAATEWIPLVDSPTKRRKAFQPPDRTAVSRDHDDWPDRLSRGQRCMSSSQRTSTAVGQLGQRNRPPSAEYDETL